jgi:hypothetical protein
MKYVPDQVNYRGKYRVYDPNGKPVIYLVGDVVTYNSKNYIARDVIKNKTPETKDSGWEFFEGSYEFIESEIEPDANVGDRWRDLVTGRLFTRIQDEKGFHWVEL